MGEKKDMPTQDQFSRERELFEHALRLTDPDARKAFLDGACGDDGGLRDRVAGLLRAHEEAEGFLPKESPGALTAPAVAGEGPGSMVGRYKLLQQIGEGGCGVVYMAEQTEPVRR